MRISPQVEEFRTRSPESVQSSVWKRRKFRVDADKLLGMRVRQRLKEHGVDHREYPRRGSDPQHQAQHRGSGKTQILAHHADRELEVLPQRFHETPHALKIRSKPASCSRQMKIGYQHLQVILLDSRYLTTTYERLFCRSSLSARFLG